MSGDRDPSSYGLVQIFSDPNVVGLLILFAVSLSFIIMRPRKFLTTSFKMGFHLFWIYAFIGIIVNTFFALPLVNYFYIFEFLAVVLFGAVLYSINDFSHGMKNVVFIYFIFSLLIFVALITNLANLSFSSRLDGGYFAINPNLLAMFCAIVCLFSIVFFSYEKRVVYLPVAFVSFVGLILTNSRTMYFAFIVAFLYLLLKKKSIIAGAFSVGVSGFGVLMLLLLFVSALNTDLHTISNFVLRDESVDSLGELTGRTEVWLSSLSFIAKSPVYGYGFKGSRLIVTDYVKHSHNVFLEILLTAGLIGLFIWLKFLFHLLKDLMRLHGKLKPFLVIIFIVIFVDGLMSASFCYSTFQLYLLIHLSGLVNLSKSSVGVKKDAR
ncbi:O-antigen ligase family protein [Candidatus Woesearchaeota archaeon]|nr:O-antigen ligase family protein [Candidatus Woesearchaeota archaeon]